MNANLNVGDLVFHINKELKSLTEKKLKTFGIGMGQVQILMLYYENSNPSLRRSDMVKLLKIDKGNVSRNVSKLLNKNYLVKDEEGNLLEITEKGLAIKADILKAFGEINTKMLSSVTIEMLETTYEGLKMMKENLEA